MLTSCISRKKLLSICVLFAQFSKASPAGRVIRPTKPKFAGVSIRASEIAACVGRNKYKSSAEVFDDLWKRHSPETFVGQTRQEKQQTALNNSPSTVKNIVYEAMKYKAKDSQDAQQKAAIVQAIIASNPNMSPADKAAVSELMTSRVSMAFGTRAETKTATKVEIEQKTILISDSKTYKYNLCTVGDTPFIISGKVDRIEEIGGELFLVEIKNRINHLFLEIPGGLTYQ